jgi:3-oxoacyl-[acyl-carrier protein] reductase
MLVPMTNSFTGQLVVVSGASRGIGRGIAAAFAREGAQVVLCASDAQRLAEAADAIAQDAGCVARPDTCAADLRTEDGCRRVFDAVASRHGRCDVLVHSAGATRAGAFTAQPDADWQDGFALKFFACVRLSRLFWPLLVASQGHVVSIIGGAARTPDPEFLVGGAVNAAMHNFTKGLAGLGRRDGVHVNAILPGMTETQRIERLFEQRAAASGQTVEQVRAAQIAKEGLRRLGTPDDVAALALFLCGERARHIQGTAIAVDGGATAGVF